MFNRAIRLGSGAAVLCALLALSAPAWAIEGAPATRPSAFFSAQALLARLRPKLDELKLTPEQKTKIDDIFTKAGDDLKQIQAAGGDLAQRKEKIVTRLAELKTQVAEVLTPEQKEQLDKVLNAMRPGPSGKASDVLAHLKDSLEKLNLSGEQKTQALAVFEDLKTKMGDLRTQAQSGGNAEELTQKARTIMQESRQKLLNLLTPEQQQKLAELMQAEPASKAAEK